MRNGNHLLINDRWILQIEDHPGEDDFLRTIFSNLKKNEIKQVNEIKK